MGGATGYLVGGVFGLIIGLINAFEFVIFVWAILSWLIVFDVVNVRNPTVRRVVDGLDRFMNPFIAPFRKIIPAFGGLDLSPLALIVSLELIKLLLGTVIIFFRGF